MPDDVIETLQKQEAMSVRPNLSNLLNEFLKKLRLEQRKLYDEYCIHNGDTHFLCANHFDDAMAVIHDIRVKASEYNQILRNSWGEEVIKWETTVNRFVDPLFEDPAERAIVRSAYQSLFPTREEFESPIDVYVTGPYPVHMEVADTVEDGLENRIAKTAAINTSEVYEAAKESAADRALEKCAVLLDDLDVRISSQVNERQTGGAKRRGSWEIAASEIALVSKHVSGLEKAKELADELLEVGKTMKCAISPKQRQKAYERYNAIKVDMRSEFKSIVERRDSSHGLEQLQKSLTLSGKFKDLVSSIQTAETEEQLDSVMAEVDTETSVLSARIKQLQQHVQQRKEFIAASNANLDDLVKDVQSIATEDEIDF